MRKYHLTPSPDNTWGQARWGQTFSKKIAKMALELLGLLLELLLELLLLLPLLLLLLLHVFYYMLIQGCEAPPIMT